ncbi:2-hydroxyacid dehydrogenase [Comamonas sp. CAH-2]|jgi:lactate dehydrogenase-like 2-hydroxyacid dehydrogenase|uniref:2-hydroxyacid dehydrogenase n=1 Tax=Comamonas sp. CAH-2 TaxID=2605745 RepID=UPI0012ADEE84|nr:2-hydroxyacid dehydrogenase [Comamonas sp. CAH-2]MRT20734.1 2-hydroxyacid dehydrogenase [Comamonas sp. CAH-2]
MATTRPRVLQYGKMPLPQLDAELAQAYAVTLLSEQPDPDRFLAEHGAQFEYLVTTAALGLPARVVDALPQLKFVSSFGVGFDALDQDALLRRGARVGYTPGVLDDCVADLAFALLLDATRGLSASDRFVRRGGWSQGRFGIHTRASGKRLGIFGMGRIGSTVARRASGFDMDVAYHNRRPVEGSPHQYLPSLLELARWADILVITAAGGDGTRHLVNAEVLAALGPQGFLVNVARGSVVDEAALAEALQHQRIAGAGLDVFEDEPRPLPALLALDNVVLAPHIASGTHETRRAMADLVLRNLAQFIATGEPEAEVPWSAAQQTATAA